MIKSEECGNAGISTACNFRYDTVKEYSAKLKTLADEYQVKIKKYRRRITAIDVAVYSVSGLLAGAGFILSSVTVIAPIAVPIAISAITTVAGISTAITKKLSSCAQVKLSDYTTKYIIVEGACSRISSMISNSLDDSVITADEFYTITELYNSTMTKIAGNLSISNEIQIENLKNIKNVRDSDTSTDIK